MESKPQDAQVVHMNEVRRSLKEHSQLLTMQDVADYLKLDYSTVYKMVRRGVLPAFKVGGSIRFRAEVIEEWLKKQTYDNQNVRARGIR